MKTLIPAGLLATLMLCATAVCAESPPLDEERARLQLNAFGCKACHRFGGAGAATAPDLTRIGARLTALQLQQLLTASQEEGHRPLYDPLEVNLPRELFEFLASRR